MYCYTYANEFTCIFNELQLWTHISSEHPMFIKTVASLSKVNLPKGIVTRLDDIHKAFLGLYNNIIYLKKAVNGNPNLYKNNIVAIRRVIDEFIILDTEVLAFYPKLIRLVPENKVFDELVKHIMSEQSFMLELFKNLRQQIR